MLLRLTLAALCLTATQSLAETLTQTDGRLTSTLRLSDDLGAFPGFESFLRTEALAIRDDEAAYGAEAGGGGAWTLKIADETTFASGDTASVLRRISTMTDAPEMTTLEALVWDATAGDFLRLDAFFDPGEARDEALIAISRKLREGIRAQIWNERIDGRYRPLVAQATSPDAAVLANFTLAASTRPGKAGGLTFHYNPEEIAPGPNRTISLSVQQSLFASWLNARGKALFAGEIRR